MKMKMITEKFHVNIWIAEFLKAGKGQMDDLSLSA